MFPAWAVVNAHFVSIFFSAGGLNAWAGVLFVEYLIKLGIQG